jgi:hypothetical protein
MKKQFFIFLQLFLLCLLFGCSATKNHSTSEAQLNFTVPEGYITTQEINTSSLLFKDEEAIGGINLTDLTPACFNDSTHSSISKYLDQVASNKHIVEWIIMEGSGDVLIVSLSVTDPEADTRIETIHRIFSKEEFVYDFWFDRNLISEEEGIPLFNTLLFNK